MRASSAARQAQTAPGAGRARRALSAGLLGLVALGALGLGLLASRALAPSPSTASAVWMSAFVEPGLPGGSLAAHLQIPSEAASSSPHLASAAAQQAAEIVLNPADVGADFSLAANSDRQVLNETTHTHFIVRTGRQSSYVEPDGLSGVSSSAVVASSPDRAEDIFNVQARDFRGGSQVLAVPPLGERTLAVAQWSNDPFGSSLKGILFRRGNVVGYVVTGSYEAPTTLDDILPLAQIMADRAAR